MRILMCDVMLLCDPGDNFLFPSPSFPLLLNLASAENYEPRFYAVKRELNWEADISEMESLIDAQTKFIVINDPCNPLGSCWSNNFKNKILELCLKHKLPLLADEIYEGISCDQTLLNFSQLSPSSDITIFKCSGLTKQYSLPGGGSAGSSFTPHKKGKLHTTTISRMWFWLWAELI